MARARPGMGLRALVGGQPGPDAAPAPRRAWEAARQLAGPKQASPIGRAGEARQCRVTAWCGSEAAYFGPAVLVRLLTPGAHTRSAASLTLKQKKDIPILRRTSCSTQRVVNTGIASWVRRNLSVLQRNSAPVLSTAVPICSAADPCVAGPAMAGTPALLAGRVGAAACAARDAVGIAGGDEVAAGGGRHHLGDVGHAQGGCHDCRAREGSAVPLELTSRQTGQLTGRCAAAGGQLRQARGTPEAGKPKVPAPTSWVPGSSLP